MNPSDHRAKRVAIGLDIWQLGLPVAVTNRILDWENGVEMALDVAELEQNLWDRFLEAIKERLEAREAPYDIQLQPWSMADIQLAAKQLQYGTGVPRYARRQVGDRPPGLTPPRRARRGNSRRF